MIGTRQPSSDEFQDTGGGAEGLRYVEVFLPNADALTEIGPIEAGA
jgi:hypothetical protein